MPAATDDEGPPIVSSWSMTSASSPRTIEHMLAAIPGIQFHHCDDPNAAVATALRVLPSVILQDLVMPGCNGLDLILAYRAQPATSQTPLVVLSAEEELRSPRPRKPFKARLANDYLVKPPQRAELVARVQYHSRTYRLLLKARALQ